MCCSQTLLSRCEHAGLSLLSLCSLRESLWNNRLSTALRYYYHRTLYLERQHCACRGHHFVWGAFLQPFYEVLFFSMAWKSSLVFDCRVELLLQADWPGGCAAWERRSSSSSSSRVPAEEGKAELTPGPLRHVRSDRGNTVWDGAAPCRDSPPPPPFSPLRQRAESGGHSQLPRVTGGVRGQAVLIRRDVLPWDLSPTRDNPPNRY